MPLHIMYTPRKISPPKSPEKHCLYSKNQLKHYFIKKVFPDPPQAAEHEHRTPYTKCDRTYYCTITIYYFTVSPIEAS